MSENTTPQNSSEEIDLNEIFRIIKKFFRKFLRHIVSVILFFKRKAILFFILLVVGLAIGFFIDQNAGTNTSYIQEIIIEPKYDSAKYIYNFIEELEHNFDDHLFLQKLKINPDSIHNLKEIKLIPIIKATDVLDNLQEKYETKEFFNDVIETQLEGDELKSEKYRDLYKQHKLTLRFKNKSEENSKMAASILEYIKSNEHYRKLINFTINQTKVDLEQNKTTLKFVDDYLGKLNEGSQTIDENGVVVVDDTGKTLVLTAASLLQQKEFLIEKINKQEKVLALDRELVSIVSDGGIMLKKRVLVKQMIFTVPIYLIIAVTLFYFIKYLSKEVDDFIKDE